MDDVKYFTTFQIWPFKPCAPGWFCGKSPLGPNKVPSFAAQSFDRKIGLFHFLFTHCLFTHYSFKPYDLLTLNPKFAPVEENSSDDVLLKAFCGLFGAETSRPTNDAVNSLESENPRVIDSQSFILPPFCRKDYHSTFESDYPQHRLHLALWLESVFSREREGESNEGTGFFRYYCIVSYYEGNLLCFKLNHIRLYCCRVYAI